MDKTRSVVMSAVFLVSATAALGAREAAVEPSGGLVIAGVLQPLVFTWSASMGVTGKGWERGEAVTIVLNGPLNTLDAAPSDVTLGVLHADAKGRLAGSVTIPYDGGASGPGVHVPRPGTYIVMGSGASSGTRTASARVELCPATSTTLGAIDWGIERGGRDGVLPSFLHPLSPERNDPEWSALWSEELVALWGTPTERSADGAGVQVSHTEEPGTHYAHDWNLFILPDVDYRWVAGTRNYESLAPPGSPAPLVEVEWEAQNAGNPFSYGSGLIGLPDFAVPSAGDHVYVLGRWIADTGHPDGGSHTEIHPARLVVTVRQRPAVTSVDPSRAVRADVYLSGHGGGANQIAEGIAATLDQGGAGGGRIQDALVVPDQDLYERAGPFPSTAVLDAIVFGATGLHILGPVYPTAGPSAFPWGIRSPETRAVNDRDYDFDVPLPHAPDGATAPRVEVVTHPQHTTAVNEEITYGGVVDGLPTVAHVHLPYLGADDGAYARTLLFAWDVFSPPGKLFHVTLDAVHVTDLPGLWHLWADVGGQVVNLSNLAPALFDTHAGDTIAIGAGFDVRVLDGQAVRVAAQGYDAGCYDALFGLLFGLDVYTQRLAEFDACGLLGDSISLGNAALALPGKQTSSGSHSLASPHFTLDFTVDYVPGM